MWHTFMRHMTFLFDLQLYVAHIYETQHMTFLFDL